MEPGLFKRVTGLDVKDFELLVSLGVFNSALMNDAVYKFKRYEDSSLSYTGIDKHAGEAVGGYDTVLTREEYDKLFGSQQISMSDVIQTFEDVPDDVLDSESDNTESAKPSYNAAKHYEEEPQINLSGVNPGAVVIHKAFGEGIITKIDENKIHVSFGTAKKMFSYPSSFVNGFLQLRDK